MSLLFIPSSIRPSQFLLTCTHDPITWWPYCQRLLQQRLYKQKRQKSVLFSQGLCVVHVSHSVYYSQCLQNTLGLGLFSKHLMIVNISVRPLLLFFFQISVSSRQVWCTFKGDKSSFKSGK